MDLATAFRELQRRIAEELVAKREAVTSGSPGDWGLYRQHVGHIKGLEDVQDMIKELSGDNR